LKGGRSTGREGETGKNGAKAINFGLSISFEEGREAAARNWRRRRKKKVTGKAK